MKVSEILKKIEDIKNELKKLEEKRVQLNDQKLIYEMQLEAMEGMDFKFTAAYELVTSYLDFNVASKYRPAIYAHHLEKMVEVLSKGNTTYLTTKNCLLVWEDNGVCCDTFTRGCGPVYGTIVADMRLVKPIEDGIILTLIKALKVLLRDENLASMANLERPLDVAKSSLEFKIYK